MSDRAVGRLARWGPTFIVAAFIRVGYWAVVTPRWLPNADADQYVKLSQALATGRGYALVFPQMAFHPTAFRPPLLPLLLTPGAWIFGTALWPARLLVLLIGSAVVVLTGVLASRLGGRTAGLIAAGVIAIYPPLLANDTITLTEPLALLLMLGAILLLDDRHWAWAGVCVGLILLTRPNGYLVLAVLGLWCWIKVGPKAMVGLVAISAALLAPWLVRNQIQVGTFRPTTSDGFTLAAIYGEPAQQANTFVDPVFSPAYNDPRYRYAQFDEAGWNKMLSDEAFHAVKAHPRYVWQVVRRNFRTYFDISPELNHYPEQNDGRNFHLRTDALPLYYVVTVLGLIGLATRWRDARLRVLVLLVAQFAVLSLLTVAPPRLRAPFDLACCVGVGLLVASLVRHSTGVPTASPDETAPPPSTDTGGSALAKAAT